VWEREGEGGKGVEGAAQERTGVSTGSFFSCQCGCAPLLLLFVGLSREVKGVAPS
jgi:hypothetical protein